MAACLQDPVLEELDAFSYGYDMRNPRSNNLLSDTPRSIFVGFQVLFFLFRICSKLTLLRIMKAPSRLPLSMSALKAGKGIWVDGSMLRYSKEDKIMGMRLAVVSVSSLPLTLVYDQN